MTTQNPLINIQVNNLLTIYIICFTAVFNDVIVNGILTNVFIHTNTTLQYLINHMLNRDSTQNLILKWRLAQGISTIVAVLWHKL